MSSTGLAWREGEDVRLTRIRTDKLRGSRRLAYIRAQVHAILEEVQPDIVAYEGYAMGAKMQTHQLGELGGVLKLMMWELGVDVMIVPPLALRKLFVPEGYPRAHPKASKKVKAAMKLANKDLIKQAITRYFDFVIEQSDEADAAALLLAGELRFTGLHKATVAPQLDLRSLRSCEILRARDKPGD